MTALGIRNNNPGNIVRVKGVVWEGQSERQGGRFVRFDNPVYGLRAICRVLIVYADARKARDGSRIDTVREIIERWAPPNENDTDAYVAHGAVALRVGPDDILDIKAPDTMRGLIKFVVRHENGCQPYTAAQIDKAMLLAGIEPPPKSLQASRTVKGGQVAAATGAAATVAGALETIAPALPVLDWARDNLATVLIVGGVIILAAVGYMIWARIDDRARGLR